MFRDESRSPAVEGLCPQRGRAGLRWSLVAGVAGSAALLAASPAGAQPLNCFEWVRATAARIMPHHAHPHRIHVAHAGAPRPHPAVHRVHHVVRRARPHPMRTRYIRRPLACPSHEVAMASPVPGAVPPETVQDMMDEAAGPTAEAVGVPAAAAAAGPDEAADTGPGGFAPGGPEGGIEGGAPGGPVGSIGGFPGTTGPGGGQPPIVITIPGSGAVPEPASWALMLAGFGATGAALRRRSRKQRDARTQIPPRKI